MRFYFLEESKSVLNGMEREILRDLVHARVK